MYFNLTDSMFGFSNSVAVIDSGNIQNPNFDSGVSSWSLVGNPNVSWDGNAGNLAGGSGGGLQFDLNHSDDYFGYVQEVSATAGAEVVFSALMRQSGSGATDFFGTRLEFLNASDVIIQSNSSSLGVNTSTQRVEVAATAPAGTAKVRVMIVTDTPGSPPAVSGYADSAILSGAGSVGAATVGTNLLQLVFGAYDVGEGLARGTATAASNMNIDAGLYWVTNNVTNYDAARSTPFAQSTNTFTTSSWTFTSFTVNNFQSLETGGAHRVSVSIPDSDNDRTNDSLWIVDKQYGYVTFGDDDLDPPNATLIYVGTNFSFGAGYNETNRVINVTDGDLVGGAAVDLVYSWYDPSGMWITNANGESNVFSDIDIGGGNIRVRNVSPNWDLTNEIAGDLGFNRIHSTSEMHGQNSDLTVTMVVFNIASVSPDQNELGNSWTLTVSAQDDDDDRGNATNVAATLTDPYVSRDRAVRTNAPLNFTVIDDDTLAPELGVSNIAVKTDADIHDGGWTFAWTVNDAFSGVKAGDGSANSSSNEWSPNYDLITPSNAQVITDRVFPNYASISQVPGADESLEESGAPAVHYTNVVLGSYTTRISFVDNDNDRRAGGTNIDGSAEIDLELTTITVIDDDTDPPGRRTIDNAAAVWGAGAGNKYAIIATNEMIVTNRSGTFDGTVYGVSDGYIANLSATQRLNFVFGGIDTNSGLSRSNSGDDTNRFSSFSVGSAASGIMTNYDASRSSSDGAGIMLTNVWTFTNNLVFTPQVISNLVFNNGGTNPLVFNMVDSDNDRTNDMTANHSVTMAWFAVRDDDLRGPDLFDFRFDNKATNITDGDLVNGLDITGLVRDADSGIFGTTNTPNQPVFELRNPTSVVVAASDMNDRAIADGDARVAAAGIGADAANVPVDYGQRVLGLWTVQVTAVDYDDDGWGSGDNAQSISNFVFNVIDDDTEGPLVSSNAATRPLAVNLGVTNVAGSTVTTNAVFTLTDADLAGVGSRNLTVDPYFERGAGTHWTRFGDSGDGGDVVDSGTNALWVDSLTNNLAFHGVFQDIPNQTNGQVFVATIRARKEANYDATIVDFKIEFKDTGLNDLGSGSVLNLSSLLTTDWQTFTIIATSPAMTAVVRPVLITGNNQVPATTTTNRYAYFDNFEVKRDGNPMRLVFSAYDPSGMFRGNSDVTSEMNIEVGNVLTSNVRNYVGDESSATATTARWSPTRPALSRPPCLIMTMTGRVTI